MTKIESNLAGLARDMTIMAANYDPIADEMIEIAKHCPHDKWDEWTKGATLHNESKEVIDGMIDSAKVLRGVTKDINKAGATVASIFIPACIKLHDACRKLAKAHEPFPQLKFVRNAANKLADACEVACKVAVDRMVK